MLRFFGRDVEEQRIELIRAREKAPIADMCLLRRGQLGQLRSFSRRFLKTAHFLYKVVPILLHIAGAGESAGEADNGDIIAAHIPTILRKVRCMCSALHRH